MKRSNYQISLDGKLIKKTLKLYKQGMTYRQMEPMIGKSRQWISLMIRKHDPKAFSIVDKVV